MILGMCGVAVFGFGESKKGSVSNITQGLDLQGGVSITFEVVEKEFSAEDFEDTYVKLEKRAYELESEASIYKEGNNRITVEIPGSNDAKAVMDKLSSQALYKYLQNLQQ